MKQESRGRRCEAVLLESLVLQNGRKCSIRVEDPLISRVTHLHTNESGHIVAQSGQLLGLLVSLCFCDMSVGWKMHLGLDVFL